MSHEDQANKKSLVPSENVKLTIYSEGLVKRGLESLLTQQKRSICFPSDRSIGMVYWHKYNDLKRVTHCEARGTVEVPINSKLCLKISRDASKDLSPLVALKASELRLLDLCHTDITDDGLLYLKGLTSLTALNLEITQISDAGLKHLTALTSLELLYIGCTKVTEVGIAFLKEALPNLKIERLFYKYVEQ